MIITLGLFAAGFFGGLIVLYFVYLILSFIWEMIMTML